MRNVQIPCYGGVQYGYVHQPNDTEKLQKKLDKLKSLGCTEMYYDIGGRKNLDILLQKVTFRDHILFYDHSVFQTVDEYFDFIDSAMPDVIGSEGYAGIAFDFYDEQLHLTLADTPEYTQRFQKRHIRQEKIKKLMFWSKSNNKV